MLWNSRSSYCSHGIMQFKGLTNLLLCGTFFSEVLFYSTGNKDIISNQVAHTINRVFFKLSKNLTVKVLVFTPGYWKPPSFFRPPIFRRGEQFSSTDISYWLIILEYIFRINPVL